MPHLSTFFDIVQRKEDIKYWEIDAFIDTQPFRYMRTKFPLNYYNQLLLILAQVDKYFLDIIYTDSDFLLATWDANRFLPVEISATSQRLVSMDHIWGNDDAVNEISAQQMTLTSESNENVGQIDCSSEENKSCEQMNISNAVILLGGVEWKLSIVVYAEVRLFESVLSNWITFQFVLLPRKRPERFAVMDEFVLQYDKLAELLKCEESGNIRENVIETVQMVTGTAAENTATIGIETTATSLGHAAAGVVLAVFVDIAVTASMLARAKVRKDRGKITEQQYKREIRDRLFQTSCQFVAGTTGTIVGQIVVPVPVVGAAIGGFVGSLVGLGVSMGVSKIQKAVERARKRKEIMMIEN
ncbi:uncharacterized protein LOC114533849 [Dendronephthya gigantea]|uniref:uncharacterized protein LOC114533849 n=1 Tax=Dendronephthya gigantea TaxID=151771 RepID=UPI00106AFC3F|nr:uncharacterized protein LOC114533849 [Dendronephthya gigantea]